jgi:hypothetical protein
VVLTISSGANKGWKAVRINVVAATGLAPQVKILSGLLACSRRSGKRTFGRPTPQVTYHLTAQNPENIVSLLQVELEKRTCSRSHPAQVHEKKRVKTVE